MNCLKPLNLSSGKVKCGQCMNCRVSRQAEWAGRILLESNSAYGSYFVTLTYRDESLSPISLVDAEGTDQGVGHTLVPTDLRNFHRRLTSAAGTHRYYSVGEYGPTTFRPHYHACIFAPKSFDPLKIEKVWGLGATTVSLLNPERARYAAQYTLKKMTGVTDVRLQNREPEFSRQSRHPALGFFAVEPLSLWFETKQGAEYLAYHGDITHTFRYGGKVYPLGRSVKNKIRDRLGIPRTLEERKKIQPRAAAHIWAAQDETSCVPQQVYLNGKKKREIRESNSTARL